MKKVIFIGSTSFSGSTFFDMTLGNDPVGFSCGEVYAYFHPYRPHHTRPACGCSDPGCSLWEQVKRNGEKNVYQTIFEHRPQVDFIVDSSKEPFWIQQQTRWLNQQRVATKNILIWKTPLEIAHSYKKRDMLEQWERAWVVYHRLYYSLVNDWRALRYADYTQDASKLVAVCNYLGIPYFAGKEKFWEKKHHILFGNASARVHLQQNDPQNESLTVNGGKSDLRQIYYRAVNDPQLETQVRHAIAGSPHTQRILDLLERRDLVSASGQSFDDPQLKMSGIDITGRRVKQALVYALGRLRY